MAQLVIDVDGTGYRSLNAAELRILETALAQYRTKKNAERMLEAHKEKSADAMVPVFARYDKVLRAITDLQEMVK